MEGLGQRNRHWLAFGDGAPCAVTAPPLPSGASSEPNQASSPIRRNDCRSAGARKVDPILVGWALSIREPSGEALELGCAVESHQQLGAEVADRLVHAARSFARASRTRAAVHTSAAGTNWNSTRRCEVCRWNHSTK